MEHIWRDAVDGRFAPHGATSPDRLALRWAVPAICALAVLGWAALLAPIILLFHN